MDKKLVCVDCGKEFIYDDAEQELHAKLGFRNEPKRCKDCRAAKKARFNPPGEREFTMVVCSECGKEAQVPFKPRSDKPVYCDDCFAKKRSS
jgi:CxxC-x17-CxxC domain-containing protein